MSLDETTINRYLTISGSRSIFISCSSGRQINLGGKTSYQDAQQSDLNEMLAMIASRSNNKANVQPTPVPTAPVTQSRRGGRGSSDASSSAGSGGRGGRGRPSRQRNRNRSKMYSYMEDDDSEEDEPPPEEDVEEEEEEVQEPSRGGEETDQWVQCSRCEVWRIVPNKWWPKIRDGGDEDWFCSDASWDVTKMEPYTPPCQ
uniref:CW-type domain-containing protein n=1 Tax=Polytomella parva TaxID=51329 RepID=A0A7S0UND3_9CHLO|mmetsp:Transcript_15646/g.27989  ORF Transcript_15646/g.27989 Transcript_15646/m.27989 type:complete len:201 (+) Transcript_15646:102-704(+)|eukprot:CAMPEP_0175078746 /NCGR_PEP_ID=MMETSP0052_2-20121109/24339_1 /TAXON_ID=51329 ORGANISM="Polytomella parva, Strain SAG 63-3" /NCGR_SAMPLE_ID=MMETSP0052_2 /ASSEMBLY_ACC=CAM_ASM_000194 /LENGTH=200 /DNA_ID=CAMNT_0016348801 /DNA_START=38 /DNA_END=640 /DNA_ORIENTATION=+